MNLLDLLKSWFNDNYEKYKIMEFRIQAPRLGKTDPTQAMVYCVPCREFFMIEWIIEDQDLIVNKVHYNIADPKFTFDMVWPSVQRHLWEHCLIKDKIEE